MGLPHSPSARCPLAACGRGRAGRTRVQVVLSRHPNVIGHEADGAALFLRSGFSRSVWASDTCACHPCPQLTPHYVTQRQVGTLLFSSAWVESDRHRISLLAE